MYDGAVGLSYARAWSGNLRLGGTVRLLRQAIGTQQLPPSQVITALSLFAAIAAVGIDVSGMAAVLATATGYHVDRPI